MFKQPAVYALFLVTVLFAALLNGCGDVSNSVNGRQVSGLSLSPASAVVNIGSTEAFYATASFTDGSSLSVIPTWEVPGSLGTIVSVGYAGVFTASKVGTGLVTAVFSGESATASIVVTDLSTLEPGGLVSIEVSPQGVDMPVGATQTFTAAGTNVSGESVNLLPAWSISNSSIGTFTASGTTATLDATAVGTAIISCVSGEAVGVTSVTIEGYTISITVESDTYVDSSNPGASFESDTAIKAGLLTGTPNTYYEAYFRFSLAALPNNVTSIESAVLNLYPTSAGTPALQFYNLTSAFSANTTWATKPTYGSYMLAQAFTANQYNNIQADALLAVVQGWYANPSSNFGLALRQDGSDNGEVVILSKENGVYPPVLSIIYK